MSTMRLAGIDRAVIVILVETDPFMKRRSLNSEEALRARKSKLIEN